MKVDGRIPSASTVNTLLAISGPCKGGDAGEIMTFSNRQSDPGADRSPTRNAPAPNSNRRRQPIHAQHDCRKRPPFTLIGTKPESKRDEQTMKAGLTSGSVRVVPTVSDGQAITTGPVCNYHAELHPPRHRHYSDADATPRDATTTPTPTPHHSDADATPTPKPILVGLAYSKRCGAAGELSLFPEGTADWEHWGSSPGQLHA